MNTQNGCCCGPGCLQVSVSRTGGVSVTAQTVAGMLAATVYRLGEIEVLSGRTGMETQVDCCCKGGMDVGLRPLCKSGRGTWEFLHVKEGQVFDINGQKLLVRRYVQN